MNMSTMYIINHLSFFISLKISSIIFWKVAGELQRPKNMTVGSNNPRLVLKAAFHWSPSLMRTLLYPDLRSSFVKYRAPWSWSIRVDIRGRGYALRIVPSLIFRQSWQGRSFPSFLSTKKKGEAIGEVEGQMYPFTKFSSMNLFISSCSGSVRG